MPARKPSKRTAIVMAVAALALAVPMVGLVRSRSAQAADALPGDGTTAATAGASCWGIKQQHGSSPDGLYWLSNAALQTPQQFHCDMTTAGGGWVLVGRGRQGWTFNPLGQGSAATVRSTVSGTGAFAPAALDSATIDALLNGGAVKDLPDGIRLERATNTTGTTRQDYRLHSRSQRWTWAMAAGQLLNKVVIDGATYNGSNTADTSKTVFGQTTNQLSGTQGTRRLFTTKWASHDDVQGFSFGTGVNGGSNSATNHLWTYGNEGSPIPFTRVWLRPQIANDAAGFTPLPSDGLPAAPKAPTLKSKSEAAPWGVVGMDHTGETTVEPWNTNVLALKVVGDRTIVGGRFTGVQNGPSANAVAQPYLAAFDLDGNWISTFRPTLDGRVFNMVTTADGKLIIAGDFTSVNGEPNTAGLAALDPTTGAVVPGWRVQVTKASGERALVRGLAIAGNTIYAGGSFNRVQGGTWATIKVTNAVSVSATNGNPASWRPQLNAAAVDLRVTDDGARVLAAGYFTSVNGDTNHGYFGITDAATGAPVPGIGPWSASGGSNAKYQQAVVDLGDRVIVGGSQHSIQLWDRNRTRLIDSHITKQGGDTQAIEVFDGKAYVSCHCGDWIYQGTNNWSSPTGFRGIEPINLVGSIDTTTFEYDTSWYPSGLKGAKGEGVWAIDRDQRGCLWVGGDLNRGGYSGVAANDWLGGFARFCPADSTAPTPPSALKGTAAGDGVSLSWSGATDDSGTVSYDVYRDDRVIASVWGTSFTDPVVTGGARYTVRAVDARGNRSAAPAPISVNAPAPKIATPLAFASTWRYRADGVDQGTAWRARDFADASWTSGTAMLGWGVSGLGTALATKPQTVYARTTFEVADPSAVRLLQLEVKAATGAVVYVNGVEAGRINMPTGAVTATTPAAGYVSGSAETATHQISVPPSLVRAGTNSVAVELHSMAPGATRAFVDVAATTFGASTDTTEPSAPGVTASSSPGKVTLAWSAGSDDVALGGYVISRDGTPVAVVGPMAMGYVDGEVDTTKPHTYVVTAFDTNGNTKAAGSAPVAARVNADLLPFGSSWRWVYPDGGAPAGWAGVGFDDGGWLVGPAELGYGDSDERTVLTNAPAPRPLTAYFRTTVTVTDPTAFTNVLAKLVRDDGIVVYVNGVEVGRDNMPAGAVSSTTKAAVGIADRADEKAPVSISIPATAFTPGANVIAVEVHNADRSSGDLSFDLQLTGQP